MKRVFLCFTFSLCILYCNSQVLGGYDIYGYLTSAIHPNGCNDAYVTGNPDDSIWVNFFLGDSMSGIFSQPSNDVGGNDILLETGFNRSNYIVSLLLSNGQYSLSHNVVDNDWQSLNNITWQFAFSCARGSQFAEHRIVPLDYNLDFGLSSTDTVIGIKILFLTSVGAADLAGVYLLNPQKNYINYIQAKDFKIFPNPFSDKINILHGDNGQAEIYLYDITSRKILHQEFADELNLITEDLEKGIYIYKLLNKEGRICNGKLIKE